MSDSAVTTRYWSRTLPEPEATKADSAPPIRWQRVAMVAAVFFLAFYKFEHSAAQFAGGGIAAVEREDRQRDNYIDSIEDGSSIRKVIFMSYAIAGVIALFTCKSRPWNPRIVGVSLLGAFILWAMLSVTSSDDAALTFRRLAATSLVLIGSLGFARLLRPNEVLAVALVTFTLFVGSSLLLDLKAGGRPWASDYRFAGTIHPNIQAAYCGVLCLAGFTFPASFGRKWVPRACLAFGFMMLLQTQSRTAALAVLIGLATVFMLRLKPSVRWGAGMVAACVVAMLTMFIASLGDGGKAELTNAALLGRTEQAGSLTGRVPLWEELSSYAAERLLAGYGYETFWTPERIEAVMKTQEWALQSAHNGYFDMTLQLGLIGLALGLATVLVSFNLFQSAYARTREAGYAFAYGVIAFALTNSLLESHFVKLKYPTVLAMIAVMGVLFFFPVEEKEQSPEDLPLEPATP
ncbi:MAG: O-antigen ligase family protein [Planctomycetota bacterium]